MLGTSLRLLFALFVLGAIGCGELPDEEREALSRTSQELGWWHGGDTDDDWHERRRERRERWIERLRDWLDRHRECRAGENRCDADGTVLSCRRQWPLWWRTEEKTLACDAGETCYFGECSAGPDVRLPTPGEGGGLLSRSVGSVPDVSGAIVLPWEAFAAALAGREFRQAAPLRIEQAVTVAANANDVTVGGISATFEEATDFEGDIFIVAIDSALYGGSLPQIGARSIGVAAVDDVPRVEATEYLVVAVELSGKTSWLGRDANFLQYTSSNQDLTNALPSTCCTNPELNPCFRQPGGTPEPGGCGTISCPPPDVIANFVDASRTDFRVGDGGRVVAGETSMLPDGRQATSLVVIGDRLTYIDGFEQGASEELVARWANGEVDSSSENLPGGLNCDLCGTTLCEADQFTPDWDFERLDPPAECGVSRVDVPAGCAEFDSYGHQPDYCTPECEGCFDQPAGLCQLGPTGFDGQLSTDPDLLEATCGNSVPDYCKYASGDPACTCDTECQAEDQAFLNEILGCRAGGGTSSIGVSCLDDGTGACFGRLTGDGASTLELCTSCTSDGGCVTYLDQTATSALFGSPIFHNCAIDASDNFCPESPADDTGADNSKRQKKEKIEEDNDSGQPPPLAPTPAPPMESAPAPKQPESEPDPQPEPPGGTPKPKPQPTPSSDEGARAKQTGTGTDENPKKKNKQPERTSDSDPTEFTTPVPFGDVPVETAYPIPDSTVAETTDTAGDDGPGRAEPRKQSEPKKGDPVDVASGDFRLESADLDFPAPVGSLMWQRFYRSRSGDRSVLGSNWSHNYDYRVQPITAVNAPYWASAYCKGWFPEITCVVLHVPGGGKVMFIRDPASNAFMPSAGSFDTLVYHEGQWLLRKPDKSAMVFNESGALIANRDRFGNGYTVEHEPVPLFMLYRRYCGREGQNEFQPPILSDPGADPDDRRADYDPRMCAMLGYVFEDQRLPDLNSEGWSHFRAEDGLLGNEVSVPTDAGDMPTEREIDLFDTPPTDYAALHGRAVEELKRFVALGPMPESITGNRRFRPTRVIDDLGRTLEFDYYSPSDDERSGLLRRVLGPAGTMVEYDYDRPVDQDRRLNESFLTDVTRSDVFGGDRWLPAPTRTVTYEYQPATTEIISEASSYRDGLAVYYQTFLGCDYGQDILCLGFTTTAIPGNPCFLADLARQEYLSSMTDNIITVTRNSAIIESETRYGHVLAAENYDRVVAQFHGGGLESAGGTGRDFDPPLRTSYPSTRFEYVSVERTPVGGDLTDSLVPDDLAAMYPLEDVPADLEEELWDCSDDSNNCRSVGVPKTEVPSCVYDEPQTESDPGIYKILRDAEEQPDCQPRSWRAQKRLQPGYRDTWPYFDPEPEYLDTAQTRVRLRRSRLTCEQLATVQMANAAHNDNVHRRLANNDYEWLSGNRDLVQQNLARICAWSKTVDRDGDITYFGLNYKGQALVQAIEDPEDDEFWIKERVYNADGSLIEDRRPVTRAAGFGITWLPNNGLTEYTYDEIAPEGEREWNGWIPFFWQRRGNLVQRVVHPSTTTYDVQWSVEDGLSVGPNDGELIQFRYEPIYNQPHIISHGTVNRPAQFSIIFDFDYQEIEFGSERMRKVLLAWQDLGAPWLADGANGLGLVQQWQYAMPHYPGDLNGDGVLGFDDTAEGEPIVRGVPVRITYQGNGATRSDVVFRRYFLDYAAHGGVNMIGSPGGKYAFLDYFDADVGASLEARFGGGTSEGSSGDDGMLAAIEVNRYDLGDAVHGEGGCSDLQGPFAYLLDDCGSNTRASLIALGLPAAAADAIVDSGQETAGNAARHTRRTTFTYAESGHRLETTEDGLTIKTERDSDGRVLRVTDTRQNVTDITRTLDGWPTLEETRAPGGGTISVTARQFDNEGRVVTRCEAVTNDGACSGFAGGRPVAMSFSATVNAPSYLLTRMRYTANGLLRQVKDPANTLTHLDYDTRRLLVEQRTVDHVGSAEDRVTRFTRNSDGNITSVLRGSASTRATLGSLDDQYFYDGFGRVRTHRDRRGTEWQLGYTGLGEVTAMKQSGRAYSPTLNDFPEWEVFIEYDRLRQPVARDLHGLTLEEIEYDEAGNPILVSRTGEGTTMRTFDVDGNVVWQRDPADTQTVSTYHPILREGFTSTIRTGQLDAQPLTTTVRTQLDEGWDATETELYGHDSIQRRLTELQRDELGRVIQMAVREPSLAGFIERTDTRRNLLGWPIDVTTGVTGDPTPRDTTTYVHNSRGQQIEIIDPDNQLTAMTYNAFGELTSRTMAHNQGVPNDVYVYDGYGRRSAHALSTGVTLGFEYDANGDLARERWINTGDLLTSRSYDERGRVVATTDFNAGRTLIGASPIPVHRTFAYDALDRMTEETLTIGADSFVTSSVWTGSKTEFWRRDVTYPSGKLVSRQMDGAGRLAAVTVDNRDIDFLWTGNIYTGRDHEWAGSATPDPMRHTVTLDGLGRGTHLQFDVLSRDSDGEPSNFQWANTYCGGSYDSDDCGAPLWEQSLYRDVLGRARSVQTFWGNPESAANRRAPWRGYGYDGEGRLTTVFEQEGAFDRVFPDFSRGQITNEDVVDFVGDYTGTEPILQVDWQRESSVGGLTSIQEVGGTSRWRTTEDRNPGHQLDEIALDNTTYVIAHDPHGRVTEGAGATYDYGPRGRLLAATTGGLSEEYLYDADGRLVRVEDGKLQIIAYDGDHKITAIEPGVGENWEAVWGAGTDQLIEYERFELGASGRFVPITDHRNSIVGWWDADRRQMDDVIEYTPHGRIRLLQPDGTARCVEESTGTDCVRQWLVHPFGFASAYRSEFAGIVHMRNRWYDPRLGQFLTHDPLGFVDSFNPYAYVGFDPINFFDPYGLKEVPLALYPNNDRELQPLSGPRHAVPGPRCDAWLNPDCGASEALELDRELLEERRLEEYQQGVRAGTGVPETPLIDPIDIVAGGVAEKIAGTGSAFIFMGVWDWLFRMQTKNLGEETAEAVFRALAKEGVEQATANVARLPLPKVPTGMNIGEFGRQVIRWGTGDDAARARIQTITREELRQAGVTKRMAEEWRDFYRNEARRVPQNPSAKGRADLMDHVARLLE